jgi:hypothetical protein
MQSYDWLEGGSPDDAEDVAGAECVRSVDLIGGSVASLYPDKGNLHSFQAVTPAAVLDVLVPGYTGGVMVPFLMHAIRCTLDCPPCHIAYFTKGIQVFITKCIMGGKLPACVLECG